MMELSEQEIELILILKKGWLDVFDIPDYHKHLQDAYDNLVESGIIEVVRENIIGDIVEPYISLTSKGKDIAKQHKRKVYQSILHSDNAVGNCLQACVATILELPIELVPHFVARRKADWFDKMNEWLLEKAGVYCMNIGESSNVPPPIGYSILNGKSSRGNMHSVVALNGKLFHDPYPSGEGLITKSSYTIFISPLFTK